MLSMRTNTPTPQDMLPLTPVVLHMLLALAEGEKHGYGIMKAVEQDTNGQMQIRVGSLYGSIQRMIDANLIEETDERPVPELDDERRRYYRLTEFGQRVLQAESQRLANVVELAKLKHVLGIIL
jgi:DNA-binding PadR family transcriptional regulator